MSEDKTPKPAATSTALILRPESFDAVKEMAEYFTGSPIVAKKFQGKPENVSLALMTGLELGLSPMQSLRGIDIIEGKPALQAATKQAIAMQSPACEYFKCIESTSRVATYETKRRGCEKETFSYTIEEARLMKGGFKKGSNWERIPRDMLRARAKSRLVDLVYPDIVLGLPTPEEVYDAADFIDAAGGDVRASAIDVDQAVEETNGHGGKVIDAEFVDYEERDASPDEQVAGDDMADDAELDYWEGVAAVGLFFSGVALAGWSLALWEADDADTLKRIGARLQGELDRLPHSEMRELVRDELRELYKEARKAKPSAAKKGGAA